MGLIGISQQRRRTWEETARPHLAAAEPIVEVALLAAPGGLAPGAVEDAVNAALAGTQPGTDVPRLVVAVATDRRILVFDEGFGNHLVGPVAEHALEPLRVGRSVPGVTRAGLPIGGVPYLAVPGFKKQARAFADAVNARLGARAG